MRPSPFIISTLAKKYFWQPEGSEEKGFACEMLQHVAVAIHTQRGGHYL